MNGKFLKEIVVEKILLNEFGREGLSLTGDYFGKKRKRTVDGTRNININT